jgi:D-alanyl-D-alanine carboxypeptidase/D-alanyl-D-alanine-endopeptidase (penicillin-binding protein 4)
MGLVTACGTDPSLPGAASPTTADRRSTSGPVATTTATSPATTAPDAPTTVSIPSAVAVAAPSCPPAEDDTTSSAPASVTATLQAAATDRRFGSDTVGASVWIDGWGEVLALHPDQALVPASNQKLLIASAALATLDPATAPRTTVVATGPVRDGVVQGDLVLVGGGDPDLASTGPRSLDALAALVHDRGIVGATGRALIDETRYDDQRRVTSWPAGTESLANAGGLGALVVDRNRGSLEGIGSRNADALAAALRAHGIMTSGSPGPVATPTVGVEVAGIDGPTYGDLVTQMLQLSDGLVAETLVKEIGRRQQGNGSTAAGLDATRAAVSALCLTLSGTDADGSGFSYHDARSAREWRRLLQADRRQPWGAGVFDRLPVAGRSGTLAARLTGPGTAGNVHAKTGSLSTAQAMTGELTTAGGRTATFSIVVNGPGAGDTGPAVDALVSAIAARPG